MNAHQPKKTPDIAPNKAQEIREAARRMVAQGKPPSPKKIMIVLKESGIKVTSAQVSTALAMTEFAYRKNTAKWESPRPVLPDPLECFRQTTRQNLDDAEELVRKVGSLEGAIASLVALGLLKPQPTQEQECHGGSLANPLPPADINDPVG